MSAIYLVSRFTNVWKPSLHPVLGAYSSPLGVSSCPGSGGKESGYSAEDLGSIPESGRSPGEGNGNPLQYSWTSLVAQMVKRLPIMWETQVRSLGQEDLLEEEIAIHSSTLAWKIPWTEEPGRLQSMGSQRVEHD